MKTVAVTGLAMLACADAFSTPALSGLVSGRNAKTCGVSSLNMAAEDTSRRQALGLAAGGFLAAFAPKKVIFFHHPCHRGRTPCDICGLCGKACMAQSLGSVLYAFWIFSMVRLFVAFLGFSLWAFSAIRLTCSACSGLCFALVVVSHVLSRGLGSVRGRQP